MEHDTIQDRQLSMMKEVDGVGILHMSVKELIAHLELALSTMNGNRNAAVSPEEKEACELMLALFGNSLDYMRLFRNSLESSDKEKSDVLMEHLAHVETVGGIC